jgi:hypothetical protein
MKWRIRSVATAPLDRLYVVVELLDGDTVTLAEDILLDVNRGSVVDTDDNGWPVCENGSAVYPWVQDEDGEWRPAPEDPDNPFRRVPANVQQQVLSRLRVILPVLQGRRGDHTDPRLAAQATVRGDEPPLAGYEETS